MSTSIVNRLIFNFLANWNSRVAMMSLPSKSACMARCPNYRPLAAEMTCSGACSIISRASSRTRRSNSGIPRLRRQSFREISNDLAVRHGCSADFAESEGGVKGIRRGIGRIDVDLAADHGVTIGPRALEEVGIQGAGDAPAARFVRHHDSVHVHETLEALP